VRVIVVGAGIIGVSVADALAARGAAATVLDVRAAGQGASQASAGMLAPFTEAHGDSGLLRLTTRSLALFDDWVNGLNADGRAVEYARTGTLEVAFDEHGANRLTAAKGALDALGVSSELLDGTEVRSREPGTSASVCRGLLIHPHGFVRVDSLIAALAHRARFAGATVETPAEAVAIDSRGEDVAVHVDGRTERAEAVVIAAGAWSGKVKVAGVSPLPVRPVRGQLLHLGWTDRSRPSRIVWGPRCYTVPWSDGSVLVGATVEEAGFDESATVEGVRELAAAAVELLPGAARARFDAVRVGLRPALPDGLPAIGPLAAAPRVVVATGHYRNGVLLAPVTAEMVANYLVGGVMDEMFPITAPDRFSTGPSSPSRARIRA
jgi:glycine oxidase